MRFLKRHFTARFALSYLLALAFAGILVANFVLVLALTSGWLLVAVADAIALLAALLRKRSLEQPWRDYLSRLRAISHVSVRHAGFALRFMAGANDAA